MKTTAACRTMRSMPAISETNPQIYAVLIAVQAQLRAALVPGSFGDYVLVEPAAVHDGKLGRWKGGFVKSIDLAKIGGKP